MKRETFILKAAVFLMGIPVLALCIFWLPLFAKGAAAYYPAWAYLPVFISLYATAILFFFALYQTLKLLTYIDQSRAFSELSVKALQNIKYCATIISIMYVICLPLLYYMAEVDDAPGIVAFGFVITFASVIIAVFAAVLQKLLKNAIDIKSENDLTV